MYWLVKLPVGDLQTNALASLRTVRLSTPLATETLLGELTKQAGLVANPLAAVVWTVHFVEYSAVPLNSSSQVQAQLPPVDLARVTPPQSAAVAVVALATSVLAYR